MEPPAKRRRQGKSPLDRADQDDDELSFEPHEVLAKRDPGYKLSLERAYADNRFQVTMAHIFEKYGRDFEGIGDEIDMVTGEIVVNNGHVQNMRNEVDVGVPGVGGGEDDDDEEGILLEDLTDDEGGQVSRSDNQGEEADEENKDGEEDEEDRIMAGREPHRQSTSLIPISRPQAAPQPSRLPRLLSGLYGGGHLGYGPPPAFGASPLSFGASPFAMEPWGLPNSFSDPSWEPPDIFPRQPRLLPSPGDRYEFPVQDGGSSIWATDYRFKDNEPDRPMAPISFGPRPPPARTRTKPMKYLLPASAQKRKDQEVDEDAILTGKSTGQEHAAEADETLVDDDDDDLLISGTTPSREPVRKAIRSALPLATNKTTRPQTERTKSGDAETSKSKKKRRKQEARAASSESEPEPPGSNQLVLAKRATEPPKEEQDDSRRRSGRVRKQVDFMGKISWTQAREERRPQQNMTVQLPEVDLTSRDEYEMVDETVEEVADSADEGSCASEPSKRAENMASGQPAAEKVVPDSQDASTPQSSGDARKTTSNPNPGRPAMAKQDATSSIYLLSDDEMPILSKPKLSKGAKSPKKQTARTGSPGPPDSGIGDSTATLSSTEDAEQQDNKSTKPSDLQPRKRLRPRKSDGTPDHTGSEQSSAPAVSADDKPPRLAREVIWLKRPNMDMEHTEDASINEARVKHPRSAGSRDRLKAANPASAKAPAADEELGPHEAAPHVAMEDDLPPVVASGALASPHRQPPNPSPAKPPSAKPTPQKQAPTPSKPQTPRHTSIPTRAPSSRRSILSLLSDDAAADDDDDDDDERDLDELGRSFPTAAPFLSSGAASRKIWKSSARTTEVYHTPVKRRPTDVVSPGSVIKTPGGTARTCGLDGYRCGRDFCFTCL